MSQRGIRLKLLVFDGKIAISYTNYVFENATKNFVNTTKEPVYKAHGPNRLAENYTNTTLCGRKQAAIKRKTDAVEHRLEQPGKRGSCRMRNNPFRIFLGGGGLTKYVRAQGERPRREREEIVRAQGGRPRREREEIVRAPRGKLLPEAGDRPAPGREAPAPYPTEGAGIRAAASGSDGASQQLPCQSARTSIPARDARGIPQNMSRYSPRLCRSKQHPKSRNMLYLNSRCTV